MQHILFVCTGNICRSPMAEGMLRAALGCDTERGEWLIDSAGTHAGHGNAPEPAAVAVAAAYGAEISALRSRPFEKVDFERFGTIIALDHGHLDLIRFIRPGAFSGRITLLPAAGRDEFIDVPDPYGGGRRDYEKAGRLIAEGVAALVAELTS